MVSLIHAGMQGIGVNLLDHSHPLPGLRQQDSQVD
jgi:hypothetical protein